MKKNVNTNINEYKCLSILNVNISHLKTLDHPPEQ